MKSEKIKSIIKELAYIDAERFYDNNKELMDKLGE